LIGNFENGALGSKRDQCWTAVSKTESGKSSMWCIQADSSQRNQDYGSQPNLVSSQISPAILECKLTIRRAFSDLDLLRQSGGGLALKGSKKGNEATEEALIRGAGSEVHALSKLANEMKEELGNVLDRLNLCFCHAAIIECHHQRC